MVASLYHRGPDDGGLYEHPSATLGMRRLSIIDLSPHGHQPMPNEDETVWIVCNGEIYNFQELRHWLKSKGHLFRSHTDTEVILHLYEALGSECVNRLRGMFAFAIFNEANQELFLARDRLGIKPLYYTELSHGFVFASEIKALLASGLWQPELDLSALDHYLTFGCVPAPYTLIKGVHALPPGYALRHRNGQAMAYRYWDLPAEGTVDCSQQDVIPQIRCLLEESIALHQVSDVPLGAFLSGGIDSTAVVGLMARLLERPVRTFSVGFQDVPVQFDELSYAKLAAKAFQTDHTEVVMDGQDVLDELDDIIWHLDQPSADGVNSYFVSRAARQGGLTVALSGLGGDEVFGGYGTYDFISRWGFAARAWGKIPPRIRRMMGRVLTSLAAARTTGGRWHKLGQLQYVDSPLGLYALARMLLWPHERYALYSADMRQALGAEGDSLGMLDSYVRPGESLWQMVTCLEMRSYMGHRLLRDTDAMSMAHSLEVRVPLIDHKLVEFVAGLPPSYKVNKGQPKRLLTAALTDVLPKEIVNRPKHGFEFPMGHWMKNHLRQVVEDALSKQRLEQRGLFDAGAVRNLYQTFQAGQLPYATIWQFVVLELWLQRNVDAPVAAVVST